MTTCVRSLAAVATALSAACGSGVPAVLLTYTTPPADAWEERKTSEKL